MVSTIELFITMMLDSSIVDDKCRRCKGQLETIDHIISGCQNLAQNEYTKRHNNVVNIIHQKILKNCEFPYETGSYYKWKPPPVIENEKYKIYYDRTILSNNTFLHNRPDITFVDKSSKSGIFIDIAVPSTKNISKTYSEKTNKYAELAIETKRNWNLSEIKIIPIIISSEGIVHKRLKNDLKVLGLNTSIVDEIQKAVIIDTCHITRTFLNLN